MKLSIETYAIREKVGDEQAIRLLKAAGFDGIDYSFYYTPTTPPSRVRGIWSTPKPSALALTR